MAGPGEPPAELTPEERAEIEKFPEMIKFRNRQKSARAGKFFLFLLAFRPLLTGYLTEAEFGSRLAAGRLTPWEIADAVLPLALLAVWKFSGKYRAGYLAGAAMFADVIAGLYARPHMLGARPVVGLYLALVFGVLYGARAQGAVERLRGLFGDLV